MARLTVRWLEELETFYRSIGLLGSGFWLSQDDRAFLAGSSQSLVGRPPPPLSRALWLQLLHSENQEAAFLGAIHGSNVLRRSLEDVDHFAFVKALRTISRGSFTPTDLDRTWHDIDGHTCFIELRCTLGERPLWLYHPAHKWLDGGFVAEINRWIAPSGRRFVVIGGDDMAREMFACVDESEERALVERGIEPRSVGTSPSHPRELVPLVEHYMAVEDFARVLDITTFNPSLGDRAPALHYYRGVARAALSGGAEGWPDAHKAKKHGMADATERFEAWLHDRSA